MQKKLLVLVFAVGMLPAVYSFAGSCSVPAVTDVVCAMNGEIERFSDKGCSINCDDKEAFCSQARCSHASEDPRDWTWYESECLCDDPDQRREL